VKIWVVQPGEPLPFDAGVPRLLRSGIVASALAGRGHEVTWWASAYNQQTAAYRGRLSSEVRVATNLHCRLLASRGYAKTVSVRRILDHRDLARDFKRLAGIAEAPDVIFCAYPPIELADACIEYAARRGIPVIVDVRDLWPDIFVRALPRTLRSIGGIGTWPFNRMAKRIFSRATAVFGITDTILDWALAKGGRKRGDLDRSFPHAYVEAALSESERNDARRWWRELGITDDGDPLFVFFGTISSHLDIEGLVGGAREMERTGVPFKIVICGSGALDGELRATTRDVESIMHAGWVDARQIWACMEMATAGLLPYKSLFDFEASIPNKPIEYMAGGLPVVSGLLQGELKHLLESERCGLSYRSGDAGDFARVLTQLATNPELATTMGLSARRVYETRFRADKVYAELCDQIERVAQAPRPTRTLEVAAS
jgi:glycosyltransferase involved in cell wall biosynthesis